MDPKGLSHIYTYIDRGITYFMLAGCEAFNTKGGDYLAFDPECQPLGP